MQAYEVEFMLKGLRALRAGEIEDHYSGICHNLAMWMQDQFDNDLENGWLLKEVDFGEHLKDRFSEHLKDLFSELDLDRTYPVPAPGGFYATDDCTAEEVAYDSTGNKWTGVYGAARHKVLLDCIEVLRERLVRSA